ncbi:(2Fe-2S)-binding protein [Photobacterium lucens]|uniref:(2Fe-2S)-binding protein n=1 Tax=Photobacterium lucens TaxID=2562949 RepID=UPI00137144BE|nr:(2Fe-2S)-binding protein [Photobacterium lucens]MBP2699773.1 (2Fe-2S)-binding protein [Vibrio parahaemolyticus]MZG55230.1 (2Fe-2S)-binding protein [Photobacterium lucens]MZG57449.1 (2Fe-2S)-binding protein [Photobacterium lucens]MZG79926.1 (2Fe-2S)-binding protein [Photobacterium lucens]
MYVCLCHAISDKKIVKLANEFNVTDIRVLRQLTPLGSQCGKCIRQAQHILQTITPLPSKIHD